MSKIKITSFGEAEEVFERAKDKTKGKKLGNNTWLKCNNCIYDITYYVVLHNTPVVLYEMNGNITLNSGSYKTSTTKERMNFYTPSSVKIFQDDYVWYVEISDQQYLRTYRYFDGFSINVTTKNTNAIPIA